MKVVPFKESYSVAAASLTGFASNVTGAAWTLTTTNAGDGLAHKVTIRNDAAVDHSAKTVILSGLGANGEAVTETLTLPGVSATVTSTKFYKELISVVPSATIGTDTMDIGWSAVALTKWLGVRLHPATLAVYAGGTINYDIQHSHEDNALDANDNYFTSASGKTASYENIYSGPIQAVRVLINSHTAGTVRMVLLMGQ